MIKKLSISIFIIFLVGYSHSQLKLTGKVYDQESNVLEFVSIIVKKDSTTILNTYTDSTGLYNINILGKGQYSITYYLYEFTEQITNVFLQNDTIINVSLNKPTKEMEEIIITAKAPIIERKVDRLVFNLENIISASGGDAIDALRITPRVKVLNDQISMVGKGGLGVMIDDKMIQLSGDELINFLKTIKSDDIKSIEVITNPPAKYNAEGNSGLINIITKKARKDSWKAAVRSLYQQASYGTETIGGSFNYQKNKITLVTNMNGTNGSISPVETSEISYPTILWSEKNKRRDFSNMYSARVAFDYKISDKINMGLNYNGVNSSPIVSDDIRSSIIDVSTQQVDSFLITKGENQANKISNTANYYLTYAIDTLGKKLSFDYNYFNNINESDRIFNTNRYYSNGNIIQNSLFAGNNIGSQTVNNSSFNIDMKNPLKWMELNYGARVSFTETNSKLTYYNLQTGVPIIDANQSNQFLYKENTQSVFVSGQKEINEKWDTQLGVRLENTRINGHSITLNQTNSRNYTKLFPTAYVTYTPNDNHNFSLNYGRRINRPSFNMLNPFKWIASPYSYTEGNPFLLPSFNSNVEFEYSYKDFWTNYIYFSSMSNGFEQVVIVDSTTKVQRLIPQNFITSRIIGLSEYVTINPSKWMKINLTADIFYSLSTSKIPVTLSALKGWNSQFGITNDFTLNKNKTALLNVTFNYTTKGVSNLDRSTAYYQLNASLKLFFLKKKLQFSINANDILSSCRPSYLGYSNNSKTTFKNYYDQRFVRVSLSYNFGGKLKAIQERENKNQEEIIRGK